MAELTPMKRQYLEIKERHKDCILFFRLGDFYEMFDKDAQIVSEELDLTLTTRDRNLPQEEQTPMCGVPYHSSEAYITRLIAKGYKVAICEQMEDPAQAKGLVARDVVQIITPGTVTAGAMLEDGRNNYICSIYIDASGAALCFADISTGEMSATGFQEADPISRIKNEFGRFSPREVILNHSAMENDQLTEFLHNRCLYQECADKFDYMSCSAWICQQFSVPDVDTLGLGNVPSAVCATGGLLSYLAETQKTVLTHIDHLEYFTSGTYMELDITTRRNLELTEIIRDMGKKGSLLWVLDQTKTPMGGRLLRSFLERPLLNPVEIRYRQNGVEDLFKNSVARRELMRALREMGDIERIAGRITLGSANGRDLAALSSSLSTLPDIKGLLQPFSSKIIRELSEFDALEDVRSLIDHALVDEPPFSVREGGIIRKGYDQEVDRLSDLLTGSKEAMTDIEAREKSRTGKRVKVGYNKVFGYYIEIPRSSSQDVPEEYVRKQTLANCERFITPELKELETTLLTAKERLLALEYELFSDVREQVSRQVGRIKATAFSIAQADVLSSLAEVAVKNNYCMPEIDYSGILEIRDGRHPMVEQTMKDNLFVSNDTLLDNGENRLSIITGPNMAGKSTYMRQTAIIVLMAQIGSFVPAKSARIGIVDRIFTRIGASDDLTGGSSTFMIEMTEVADILKNATAKSLLILDEIGRGTSTYDGLAIARAVLEYCADRRKLGAKTLFATHYHELTTLEGQIPGVKNYNISAKKRGDDIVFLRKIVPGGADESYGIEVAKLAGVPEMVIRLAKSVLFTLENQSQQPAQKPQAPPSDHTQISISDTYSNEVIQALKTTDLNTLTPLEAMNLLYTLKNKL